MVCDYTSPPTACPDKHQFQGKRNISLFSNSLFSDYGLIKKILFCQGAICDSHLSNSIFLF